MAKNYFAVDTSDPNYRLIEGTFFNKFDCYAEFIKAVERVAPGMLNFKILSERLGQAPRREVLVECSFKLSGFSAAPFFIYVCPLEGGGRFADEQRIQLNPSSRWNPNLNSLKIAHNFLRSNDKTGLETYILGIYKTSENDDNIIFSGIYPNSIETTETDNYKNTTSSIQIRIGSIQKAYQTGVDMDITSTGYPIINFTPNNLFWYMINRDTLHIGDLEKIAEFVKMRKSTLFSQVYNAKLTSLQQIYFGAPGTGKSFEINQVCSQFENYRTTFHPDTDYAAFVGSYKPITIRVPRYTYMGDKAIAVKDELGKPIIDSKITYNFTFQSFLKAYIAAWKEQQNDDPKPVFLIIEEINRGNCAQIFGDIFQLLDRNAAGFSEYSIVADDDLAKELGEKLAGINIAKHDEINALYIGGNDLVASVISGVNLLLPNNLHIWATMNTSDQSLFPIDSAFKRRWNWKYVPIDTNPKDNETQQPLNWKFEVAGNQYSWGKFLEIVNPEIYDITESSDKQMGYFFAKADPATGIISEEVFLNKVMFYLWTDVFKDYDVSNEKFQNKKENRSFRFTDFFEDAEALANFIENCGLEILNDNSEDYNPGDIEDSNDLTLYDEYQEYWGKVKDFVNNKLGSNIASQAPLKQNWYNIHFGASGIVTFISRNTQTKHIKVGFSISKKSKHFDKFKIEEIKEYIPSAIERTLEKNILIEVAKTDVVDFNSQECMDWIADNVKQFYELGKKLISSNK